MKSTVSGLLMSALVAAGAHAADQARPIPIAEYPAKPVRWIITFPVGGPTEFLARAIGTKLAELLGQPFVIESHAGAGGRIGTELVARAAPDGYSLLFGSGSAMTVAPAFGNVLPYDPFASFAPVGMLVANPQLLIANPALPVRSVRELVALARARPGELTFGSGGQGSSPHLGMELLKADARIDLLHVPYKGTAPAMTDLLGGHVMLLLNTVAPGVLAMVKAGKVRALGVTSLTRSAAAPEVPTIAESGVPGYENVVWFGMFAPAKTPATVVSKLNGALVRLLAEPATVRRLVGQGAEPVPGTPQALADHMRVEYRRLSDLIRANGIRQD